VIAQFLCDRLEDEAGLKETAQGLVALQKAQRFGKDEATLIATTYGLFSEVFGFQLKGLINYVP
jgi:hypothetical protein